MKSFLKHLVLFFFGLIIFMAIFDAGSSGSQAEKEASDNALSFEQAVNNGEIVQDGMMDKGDEPIVTPNTVGEGASKVGNSVVGALASFLELIGETVYNFFA